MCLFCLFCLFFDCDVSIFTLIFNTLSTRSNHAIHFDAFKSCHPNITILEWKDLVTSIGGMENIMAIYDDHDFGKDNADSSFKHRNATLQLFNKYFRKGVSVSKNTDGAYTSKVLKLGKQGHTLNVKVIMLDTRYHKLRRSRASMEKETYLGNEQWHWLEQELKGSKEDVILLVSSTQVLSDDKFLEETWGYEMPLERKRLLDMILHTNKKVILLSGDVHYAEISQAICTSSSPDERKKSLIEITSSGISHTFTYTLDGTRQLVGGGESGKGGEWVGLMYDTYQSLLPLRYRQHRFKHHYKGLNVGIIDFFASNSNKNVYKMKISILNHENKVVMEHVENINKNDDGFSSIVFNENKEVLYDCTGIRGKLPAWRYILFMSVLISIFPFFGHFLVSLRILMTIISSFVALAVSWFLFFSDENEKRCGDGDIVNDDKLRNSRKRSSRVKKGVNRKVSISEYPPDTKLVSPVGAWTEEEKSAVHGDDRMDDDEKQRVMCAMKKMKSSSSRDESNGHIVDTCTNGNETACSTPVTRRSSRRNSSSSGSSSIVW